MALPDTLLTEGPSIAGLDHFTQYASAQECARISEELRSAIGLLVPQSYGKMGTVNSRDFGDATRAFVKRLTDDLIMQWPSFVQMNIYNEGRGIGTHIDNPGVDHSVILGLSSSAIVQFRKSLKHDVQTQVLVSQGDIYTLKGIARKYAHGIMDGNVDWMKGLPYPRSGQRSIAAFVRSPD